MTWMMGPKRIVVDKKDAVMIVIVLIIYPIVM